MAQAFAKHLHLSLFLFLYAQTVGKLSRIEQTKVLNVHKNASSCPGRNELYL